MFHLDDSRRFIQAVLLFSLRDFAMQFFQREYDGNQQYAKLLVNEIAQRSSRAVRNLILFE
jgi:hypothetical protein